MYMYIGVHVRCSSFQDLRPREQNEFNVYGTQERQ